MCQELDMTILRREAEGRLAARAPVRLAWPRVALPALRRLAGPVTAVLVLAVFLAGCARLEPIRGERIPGLPHEEKRFLVTLDGGAYLVDAQFVGQVSQTVIAVPANRAEVAMEMPFPEAAFFDDALKPTAVDVALRVTEEGVCPEGVQFTLARNPDGDVKAFYYSPRDAWTVFGHCGVAGA
ncbi:MAG: hypothetical protein AAFW69_09750 [Pseudomonadota bacterium]